ncbi:MAG: putative toxin-antitoxin system toxin component, PIN family [Chloroflexota bacterium]|nr:MAG: putative toxin-antitoxin system toxin component, PIN family [Chloroflexota bacterium]
MIRAVVDTNILIRALIKPQGTVGPVLTRLRDGNYTLLYAEPLLDELVAKLALPRIRDKYHLTDDDVETVLALILLRGEPVVPQRRITACRDPKDDIVLEVAVAGEADYIVTGDDDLLVLHPFEGIPIVGPAEFLKALEPTG